MKKSIMARRRFLGGLAAAQPAVSQVHAADIRPARWNLVIGCDHAGFSA
jgi:hypothetical protein